MGELRKIFSFWRGGVRGLLSGHARRTGLLAWYRHRQADIERAFFQGMPRPHLQRRACLPLLMGAGEQTPAFSEGEKAPEKSITLMIGG